MKLIYGVKDKPKFGQLIIFAIQQLLAIMAATLVVPVIINGNANLSGAEAMDPAAALFGAGIGTLVYILFTKKKSPVFLGSSFAFIGSMTAAFGGAVAVGYLGMILGAIFAGLVYVILAIIIKLVGVNWIDKLMPAVVIGPTVAIIGLSLAGNAIGDLAKVNYSEAVKPEEAVAYEVVETYEEEQTGEETIKKIVSTRVVDGEGKAVEGVVAEFKDGNYSYTKTPGSSKIAILCGLITLIVTMVSSCYGKRMAKLIPFVIGILSGYAAASIFYLIGYYTGNHSLMIINYSSLLNIESVFSLPRFTFITAYKGLGQITVSNIITVLVAYVPVAFVVFAEHIADHKNLSSIIEQDLLRDPGLSRTLLGDGVGSMAGAIFGGCPNTTYGESVGCVAITKNASVSTIIAAAIGAIVISFVTPFVAFVNSIPSCVMGGVCMALYGFIAISGLKMIQNVDFDKNKNLFVASAILVAGVGGLSISFGNVTLTSIACALIIGIIANIILAKSEKE